MSEAVEVSATGALMQGVVKVVRVMGVEVVWCGVVGRVEKAESCVAAGQGSFSDKVCQSSEADAA